MRRTLLMLAAPVASALLLAGCGTADSAGEVSAPGVTREQLLAANQARFDAMTRADTEALAGMLAENLKYVHSHALVETREQLLESIASGAQTYHAITVEDVEARPHEGGGVVLGRVRMRVGKDAPFEMTNLFTAVLTGGPDDLRLTAFQSTRVPEPAAQ